MNEPIINLTNFSFFYPESEERALNRITLRIYDGEYVGITGPTGAGKTTLVRTFNALIPHLTGGKVSGSAIVNGLNIEEHYTAEMAQYVGMVFDEPESQLIAMTVKDQVAFGPENLALDYGEVENRVKWATKVVRMDRFLDRLTWTLSGGQKQRTVIASALAMKPKILVLDEPTVELDPVGKFEVYSVIEDLKKQHKITVVIVEPVIDNLVEFINRLIIMDSGKIIYDGDPHEVLSHIDELKRIGVQIPDVTLLAHELKKMGLYKEEGYPITLKEAYDKFTFLKKIPQNEWVIEEKRKFVEKGNVIIEVENLWHIYEEENVLAIKDVSLKIREREFVAIIGQNGSGKTTLVKHFNGLLKPTKGTVKVFGIDVTQTTPGKLSKRVGYVFQNPDHQIFTDSVEKEIRYGPENLGLPEEEIEKRVEETLEIFGLKEFRDVHPYELSKGLRHRLAIASIFAMKPEVIILDEPTTGLDWHESKKLLQLAKELIEKEGVTIILVTHDMKLVAEFAERAIVMSEGNLLMDDSVRNVFRAHDIMKKAFLKPPQITRLAQMYNPESNILSLDEFLDVIKENLG